MNKNFVIALAIVLVTGTGLYATQASALSAGDVQSQIARLMQQLQDLTAQINALRGQANGETNWTAPATTPGQHRVCALLSRNLSQGSQGDDVRGLQEFLRDQGYLAAQATGYFGPMTASAVAKWQASQGVSAAGSFGPLSRDRLNVWCGGGGGATSGTFSASPQSGTAPLMVNFTYQGTEENGQYYIEFGDGVGQRMDTHQIYCVRAPCISPSVASHTYASTGTYTASVSRYIACLYSNPRCMIAQPAPLAQVKVVVTGTVSDPANDPQCKRVFTGCVICIRLQPGGHLSCPSSMLPIQCDVKQPKYCAEYFDSSEGKPPVISGFSGPTTLVVNTIGTWTINASDPENGQLSYQVSWGDENMYAPMANAMTASQNFIQTTTFTHAYANPGTYTVHITVRDSSGQQAQTATTVQVGNSTTPVCPSGTTLQYKCFDKNVRYPGAPAFCEDLCWKEGMTF